MGSISSDLTCLENEGQYDLVSNDVESDDLGGFVSHFTKTFFCTFINVCG